MAWQTYAKKALSRTFRGVWKARRAAADLAAVANIHDPHHKTASAGGSEPDGVAPYSSRTGPRRRSILFITVDQQRFDALGCNGGTIARTPAIDALAATGLNYGRAHVQNVVCMPARSTMLTGQHPWTHGVVANGVRLPDDAPSVAEYLRTEAGYATSLIGKAHFDPHLDPALRWFENRASAERLSGPWHGFEHVEFATHGPMVGHHYAAWLWENGADYIDGFGGVLTAEGGGATGAPEVGHNPIPTELYHTAWVAERAVAWLDSVPDDRPFFCWMSFPDPHHPLDPPLDEVNTRIDYRDLDLPAGHPGSAEAIAEILAGKPRHWLDWYEQRFRNPEGGPVFFDPRAFTADQVREVNAMIHVENELIDDACGRVLDALAASGRLDDTDVFFTSDHGELQGDYGLMFKGPYHVESLLHVPMIWRPASSAAIAPSQRGEPVGHVDLAPTFCEVAGLPIPDWMQGRPLPTGDDATRERVITTFDSQFAAVGMHLQTIFRDGLLCTRYRRSDNVGGRFALYWRIWGAGTTPPRYEGTEGELYDVENDPHQFHNLWDDPAWKSRRDELVADLDANLPERRPDPLPFAAPT